MSAMRRLLALLVLCLFVSMLLFYGLFLAKESAHECSGEDCVICALIGVCEQILRNPMLAALLCCALAAAGLGISLFLQRTASCDPRTPVILKVKLLN